MKFDHQSPPKKFQEVEIRILVETQEEFDMIRAISSTTIGIPAVVMNHAKDVGFNISAKDIHRFLDGLREIVSQYKV